MSCINKVINVKIKLSISGFNLDNLECFIIGHRGRKTGVFDSTKVEADDYVIAVFENNDVFSYSRYFLTVCKWNDFCMKYNHNSLCDLRYISCLKDYDNEFYYNPIWDCLSRSTKDIPESFLLNKAIFCEGSCSMIQHYKGIDDKIKQYFDNSLTSLFVKVDGVDRAVLKVG